MNRRIFLLSSATLPFANVAFAMGNKTVEYTPGAVDAALAEGKTVFIDFAAAWCSTCARQERVISALRSENPKYNEMVFFTVDWDKYRNSDLTQRLDIPRRSTLVVLKGDQELGRIIAGTSESQIKELLETGLAAAMA